MKTPKEPQTVAGWKRRAVKAEALVETMRGHNLEASGKRMNEELRAYAMGAREVDAVTVRAFKAINANSRYVRQDAAVRLLLSHWANGQAKPIPTLRSIAIAINGPTPEALAYPGQIRGTPPGPSHD